MRVIVMQLPRAAHYSSKKGNYGLVSHEYANLYIISVGVYMLRRRLDSRHHHRQHHHRHQAEDGRMPFKGVITAFSLGDSFVEKMSLHSLRLHEML